MKPDGRSRGKVSAGRRASGARPEPARTPAWRDAPVPLGVGVLAAGAAFALIDSPSSDPRTGRAHLVADRPASETAPSGRAVFARMGCGSCHAFKAGHSAGAGAPDLDVALAAYTRRTLTAKILDPYPDSPPTSFRVMPQDFGDRLSRAEVDALVTFLLEARDGT